MFIAKIKRLRQNHIAKYKKEFYMTYKRSNLALCITLASLLQQSPLLAQPWKGHACPSIEKLTELTEQAIRSIPPIVGLSISIYNPHCGQFNYTSGYADYDKRIPVTENITFPIASHTKPVLIAIALILMEEHHAQFPHGLKTKLTDILDVNHHPFLTADGSIILANHTQLNLTKSEFYQEMMGKEYDCRTDTLYACPRLDAVDMHHLLMESSGFADIHAETDLLHAGTPDTAKYILSKLFSPVSDSAHVMSDLQTLKKFGLVAKSNPDPIIPMQSHNTDAMMLAVILERVSGETLPALLEKYITKPLKIPTDAMHFVDKAATPGQPVARRYAFLNTATEVEEAIKQNTLLKDIPPELARLLTPSILEKYNKSITSISYVLDNQLYSRPAIDVLTIDGQGFIGGLGAGGIIAEPRAYVQFYQALANGTLLSKNAQDIFNQSFLSLSGKQLSVGYGSNIRFNIPINNKQSVPSLTHTGLVPGGESRVIYDETSGTTIMVNTNFSGYSTAVIRELPTFFVTKTPYFDTNAILRLEIKYLAAIHNAQ